MGRLEFDEVNKVFPDGTAAVRDLCLDVTEGEFLVLVGPSGCGKTTALRMVAGLESISRGTIRINERVINDVEPRDRDIAMVFQNYALYPNLTVADNLGFALKMRGVKRAAIRERVASVARSLDLTELLERRPGQLSGGQRQRVAMGRAIVRQPSVFLMDEPLSNLDAALRVQLRAEVSELQRRLAVTTIYVTHDQVEAMTMGSRIAVMKNGELQQLGAPPDVYDHPANVFVAGFLGSPPMNLFQATPELRGDRVVFGLDGTSFQVPATREITTRLGSVFNQAAVVGIRPERLHVIEAGDGGAEALTGQVTHSEMLGAEEIAYVQLGSPDRPSIDSTASVDAKPLAAVLSASTRVIVRSPRTGQFASGAGLTLKVAPEDLHFFHPESGLALL